MKKTVIGKINKSILSGGIGNSTNYLLSVIFLILICSPTDRVSGQDSRSDQIISSKAIAASDSSGTTESLAFAAESVRDTTVHIFKPKLLPDNMSFLERGLWGENGFVRTIGLESSLSPQVRKHELEIRRVMLTAHQIGGFTTLGLMLATCYYGQKIIDGGVDGRRNYESTKNALVAATMGTYSLTALLSVLSPPPLIRRDESSTITLHKTLAWVHVAGMIITPILGSLINTNRVFHMDKAHFHQVAGYLTTAAFATAMIVITF